MRISTKIIGVTSICLVTAVVTAALVVYWSVRASSQALISANQEQATVQAMDKIDRFMYERTIDVQVMALSDQLREATTAKASATTLALASQNLRDVQYFNGSWSVLTVWDKTGRRLASSSSDMDGPGVTTHAALEPLFHQAANGKMMNSDLIRSPLTGQPTMYYFAPIYDLAHPAEVAGVLTGQVYWPTVLEILKSVKNSDAALVNAAGIEIGGNQPDDDAEILSKDLRDTSTYKELFGGQVTTKVVQSVDNTDKVVTSYTPELGYLTYKGLGWSLILATPTDQAFAPAQRAAIGLLHSFGLIMLVALGVILWFLRSQVIGPIRTLNEAVKRVTAGDWSRPVRLKSKDELGQLATAFNQMTDELSRTSEQLQREKTRLEASIDSLPMGFILTDDNNVILSMNMLIQEMLGVRVGGSLVASHPLKTDDGLLKQVLEYSERCLKEKKVLQLNDINHDGRILRALFAPVLHRHGPSVQAIGVTILVEDITEARILARSRDEFFSIASHELRTPLTAIRGNIQLIQQFFPDVVKNPDVDEILDDIHTSSVRLIEIVNDFLDASRLEQRKMKLTLESFNVEDILEKVIYEMHGIVREKKLYLRLDHNLGDFPPVWADKNRVKQIAYNLVGNAMKFVDHGGVTIRLEQQRRFLKVLVIDTGAGISPENQQILFHKFQQANADILTRDTTRGTGLGLYISKLLIEQMGGRIHLEHSEVGKGSTFSVTIPLATKRQQALGAQHEQPVVERSGTEGPAV